MLILAGVSQQFPHNIHKITQLKEHIQNYIEPKIWMWDEATEALTGRQNNEHNYSQ